MELNEILLFNFCLKKLEKACHKNRNVYKYSGN